MKNVRNSAACRNGSRNISATPAGLPSETSVKKPKYVARNDSTSGNLFSRSVRNPPSASSSPIQTHGRSPKPPHQLSPLPNAIGAHSRASAAGLNTCSRSLRRMRLHRTAKQLVHPTTSHDSLVDRMKKTMSEESSALVGARQRRDSNANHTPSIRQAGITAANKLGTSARPPEDGATMASIIAKMTRS